MAILAVSGNSLTDAWNSGRPEVVARCFAPDGVRQQMAYPARRIEGREAITDYARRVMQVWPDLALEVQTEATADNGLLVLEWLLRGTQEEDFGPAHGIGQTVELSAISLISMADGLIGEERVFWDCATLMDAAGMLRR